MQSNGSWYKWLLFPIVALVCALFAFLWKKMMSVLEPKWEDEEVDKEKREPKKGKKTKVFARGFFLNYQTRRRRLNLQRKGNILDPNVGRKIQRQTSRMFFGRRRRR